MVNKSDRLIHYIGQHGQFANKMQDVCTVCQEIKEAIATKR